MKKSKLSKARLDFYGMAEREAAQTRYSNGIAAIQCSLAYLIIIWQNKTIETVEFVVCNGLTVENRAFGINP